MKITKNNLRMTINVFKYAVFLFFVACSQDKGDKVEIIFVNNKEVLNQSIVYDNNIVDFNKSHFYEVNQNCIEYHSILDTLDNQIGKGRFIVFKTSELLKSDFSNINNVKLKEYFFSNKNEICLDSLSTYYKYGVIEDIVFLDTDSIVGGESGKRIITMKQYINTKDEPVFKILNN